MSTINVAAVNCSALPFAEFQLGVEVLQAQLDQDFSTQWDVQASLTAVDGSTLASKIDPGSDLQQYWSLVVFDASTSDAVRNGYRDMTRFGCPQAKVEIVPDAGTPRQWTASVSRGLLGLLVNPYGARFISAATTPRPRLFLVQPCDPLVNDTYLIPNRTGYSVAAFVLPAWFGANGGGPYSKGVAVSGPGQCSANGGSFVSYLMGDGTSAGGWQVTSGPAKALAAVGAPANPNTDTTPDPQVPAPVPQAPVPDPQIPPPLPQAPPPADPEAPPTVQPNDYFLPP